MRCANRRASKRCCWPASATRAAGLAWRGGTYAHEPYPGSCAECHAAERPTAVVNGFSHDSGGSGDCASCHHSPGVRWSDGAFSHTPAPANCSGCHAGSRPTGLVGTPPFDHAIAGTGDCKSCHAVQSATQRDWSGGSFSHSPAPTACIDCHLGIRPVGPAGTPPFDHANGGTGDCVSCHRPKSATQTNWSGAGFSHSPTPATCNGCHVTGPSGPPRPAPHRWRSAPLARYPRSMRQRARPKQSRPERSG